MDPWREGGRGGKGGKKKKKMQKEKEQNGTPTCWSGKAEQAQLPESATANQPTKQTKKPTPFLYYLP